MAVVATLNTRIGQRIRDLRERKGLTQVVLADRAGIERANLSRIENGKMEPGVVMLDRIAKALEVDLKDLVD